MLTLLTSTGAMIWWIGAGVLLVAELLTGTFYLLMIAFGFAGAGIAHLFHASDAVQIVVAAVVASIAISVLYLRRRRGMPPRSRDSQDSRDSRDPHDQGAGSLDSGQRLWIEDWQAGRARARYRGALWDVELDAGEPESRGWYEIRRFRSNTLVVAMPRENGASQSFVPPPSV